MKVALIDPSWFTGPYDTALATGLAEAGAEVRLYAGNVDADDPMRGHPTLIEHFYTGLTGSPLARLPKPIFRGLKGLSHIGGMARLAAAFGRWRPDIIHFQWAPLPVVDRRFLPALRRLAPLVLTVHDSTPFNGNPSARLQAIGALTIMNEFDALIVHTDQAMRRLGAAGIGGDRLVRVPHGPLHDVPARADDVEDRDLADPSVEFLLFGKLKHYKGIDVMIRALAMLTPEQRARAHVRVIGKPYMEVVPLLELVRAGGVERCFTFDLRFVEDDEIPRLLAQASAAVFPYREIDASGVLMAAIMAGRPIIASAIGNFAEMLRDGEDALLVPPDDAAALAQALGRFIDDAALRERLGAGTQALRVAMPSWAEIGRTTRSLYESLIVDAARRAPFRSSAEAAPLRPANGE
ncbi:MAG TPA: glycosyltransferase family 4 protein [Aliidongia sp.]|nr:glycosyltransferase family 4 protein [Aliidongia sp.]